MKHFVKTSLTKECENKLRKHRFVILIDQEGSGKTLTAVHILSDDTYRQWIKQKVTSWKDLLVFDFKDNTIVYIDNIFDGYMHIEEINAWLDALCYFFSKCINSNCNIHLIITAKKDVIEKSVSFNKSEIQCILKTCSVNGDLFSLSLEEKNKILNNQISLAKELKGMDVHCTREILKVRLQSNTPSLGFPLCAHMYAFEKELLFREACIFDDPMSYLKYNFHKTIEEDKTNGLKTLFLILIFYHSPETVNVPGSLDLKSQTECKKFLEASCPDDFFEKIAHLSYENLNEKAEEQEDSVLIKFNAVFKFRHQIYLEGVSAYFFMRYFDAVVDYFPCSILRTLNLPDLSTFKANKLVHRIKRELEKENDLSPSSFKVFKEPEFERLFQIGKI